MRHFYHKVFELGFIPLIDKPTRVCKNSATIIDNILTNCVFDNTLQKATIKSHILDHFPIIFTIQTKKIYQSKCKLFFIKKDNLTRQTRRLSSNNYLFSIGGL